MGWLISIPCCFASFIFGILLRGLVEDRIFGWINDRIDEVAPPMFEELIIGPFLTAESLLVGFYWALACVVICIVYNAFWRRIITAARDAANAPYMDWSAGSRGELQVAFLEARRRFGKWYRRYDRSSRDDWERSEVLFENWQMAQAERHKGKRSKKLHKFLKSESERFEEFVWAIRTGVTVMGATALPYAEWFQSREGERRDERMEFQNELKEVSVEVNDLRLTLARRKETVQQWNESRVSNEVTELSKQVIAQIDRALEVIQPSETALRDSSTMLSESGA